MEVVNASAFDEVCAELDAALRRIRDLEERGVSRAYHRWAALERPPKVEQKVRTQPLDVPASPAEQHPL